MKASGSKLITFADTKDNKGFRCLVQFDDETTHYVVTVFSPDSKKSLQESFVANFRPYFGMDALDVFHANNTADKLASKLEEFT
jgi:hypothetical protein